MKKILVFTATYNESGNIDRLIKNIALFLPSADMLVVDDNSPDGTGKILDTIASSMPQLHVLHRNKKLGLGTAHKLGMKYARDNDYDVLITMDSDFSHNPSYLPKIAQLMDKNDFVTGSRYITGGRSDYDGYRKFVSFSANLLARNLLGIPFKECTTSFRGFSKRLLKMMDIDSIRSDGYSFFFESIFLVSRLTDNVSEFPIYFENRASGTSKISRTEIAKSCINLMRLFADRLTSAAGNNSRHFIKYALIGILNTAVSYMTYSLFLILGTSYPAALILSYIVGIVHSYAWNRLWNFKSISSLIPETARFITAYVISFFLNLLMLRSFIEVHGMQPFIAQATAIIFTVPATFLMMRYWVFKRPK